MANHTYIGLILIGLTWMVLVVAGIVSLKKEKGMSIVYFLCSLVFVGLMIYVITTIFRGD